MKFRFGSISACGALAIALLIAIGAIEAAADEQVDLVAFVMPIDAQALGTPEWHSVLDSKQPRDWAKSTIDGTVSAEIGDDAISSPVDSSTVNSAIFETEVRAEGSLQEADNYHAIPEPSTAGLLAIGVLAVVAGRRRYRRPTPYQA